MELEEQSMKIMRMDGELFYEKNKSNWIFIKKKIKYFSENTSTDFISTPSPKFKIFWETEKPEKAWT